MALRSPSASQPCLVPAPPMVEGACPPKESSIESSSATKNAGMASLPTFGVSGHSWMYPYQRTPMGNPYISPIYPYIVGVYGLLSPRIPI